MQFVHKTLLCAGFSVLALSACSGDDGDTGADRGEGGSANTSMTASGGQAAGTGASSNSSGGTDGGNTGGTDGGNTCDSSIATAIFDDQLKPLLSTSCGRCHDGERSFGIEFESDLAKNSEQVTTMKFVEPGDTSESYLWQKVQGTQADVGGEGVRMPRRGPALKAPALKIIEDYINALCPAP